MPMMKRRRAAAPGGNMNQGVPSDGGEDVALLERIQAGDAQAFEQLVRRHAQKFNHLAIRLLHHRQDAEDVVQDAFLKVWRNPFSWQPSIGANFSGWFYRVVVNLCLDRHRQRAKAPNDELPDIPDPAPSSEAQLILAQEQNLLLNALQHLPISQQTAVQLYFYDGFSQQDAAAIMQLHLKAFESLLHRAKQALKKQMGVNKRAKH